MKNCSKFGLYQINNYKIIYASYKIAPEYCTIILKHHLIHNGRTPLSLCEVQVIRKELLRWGANINHLPDQIKKNDKVELQELNKQYNLMIKYSIKHIDREFRASKSQNEFVERISDSIKKFYFKETDYKLSPTNMINFQSEAGILYQRLAEEKMAIDRKPFIEKFINRIKSFFGHDGVSKLIKEVSQEFKEEVRHTSKRRESQES